MEGLIREKAEKFGFDLVGFAEANIPKQDKDNIQAWIDQKLYGSMDWYPRHQKLRLDFENLGFVPRSAIALGVLYRTQEGVNFTRNLPFRISEYVLGQDYHKVLKTKAKPFLKFLTKQFPFHKFRQGVDSLPISEKVLARNAGLGWIGKNTNLISPRSGSFFFLSIVLTDLELSSSIQIMDRCGTCRKCLDACPTGALFEEYKIDAGKCISHENIENRSDTLNHPLHGWIYGCDICQTVCPWNEKAIRLERYSNTEEFKPLDFLLRSKDHLPTLSPEEWKEWVKVSAVERISYEQWLRNAKLI